MAQKLTLTQQLSREEHRNKPMDKRFSLHWHVFASVCAAQCEFISTHFFVITYHSPRAQS